MIPIVEGAIARCRDVRPYGTEAPSSLLRRTEVGKHVSQDDFHSDPSDRIGDVVIQRGRPSMRSLPVRVRSITDDGKVSICGTDKEIIRLWIAVLLIAVGYLLLLLESWYVINCGNHKII